MQYPEISLALGEFGENVVNDAKKNLKKTGATTQNNSLYNSLNSKVIVRENSVELEINSNFYGAFRDQGVRGHGRKNLKGKKPWTPSTNKTQQAPKSKFFFKKDMPPIQVFSEWLKNKPLSVEGNPNSIGFLMARSAGRFGLPPNYFMTDAFAKNLPKLREQLGIAFTKDIETFLNREVFKLKKI